MNQSILFPDIEFVIPEKEAIRFDAQISTNLIHCFVSYDWLKKRFPVDLVTEQELLAAFSDYRFELEALAEENIVDESYDELGEVWIR